MRAQLLRVLGSDGFEDAPRLQRMLRYVVERSLAGDDRNLREIALAIEVFDRGADFDSGADSIVRANARRLRERLARYYAEQGRRDPVVFELPKGHYRVVFRRSAGDPAGAPAWWVLAGVLALSGAFVAFSARWGGDRPTLEEAEAELTGVVLAVDLSADAGVSGVSTDAIGQQIVTALSQGTPFIILPSYRALGDVDEPAHDYVLHGAILSPEGGGEPELALQLFSAASGQLLWPETLALADGRLSKAPFVAHAVLTTIRFDRIRPNLNTFSDDGARAYYLRAAVQGNLTLGPPENRESRHRRAEHLYRQSIELDEEAPLPWCGLAGVYAQARWLETPEERSRQANVAAERCLALALHSGWDAVISVAYSSVGFVKYYVDGDYEAARASYEKALDLGFREANIHYHLGEISRYDGNLEEAAKQYEAARRKGGASEDPWALINLANTYMYIGRNDELLPLLDEMEASVEEGWEAGVAPWLRIIVLGRQGRTAEARAVLEDAVSRLPDPVADHVIVGWLPLVGEAQRAREILVDLDRRWRQDDERFNCRDAVAASMLLGEREWMYQWLDRAIERRESIARLFGVDYEAFRQEPRFVDALDRMRRRSVASFSGS